MIPSTPFFRRLSVASALALAVVLVGVPAAAAEFPSGDLDVPSEAPPGTYFSSNSPANPCTWERKKNHSDADSARIGYETGFGRQIATIKAADKVFDSTGCGSWTPLSSMTKSPRNSFKGDGQTFSVQHQIQPSIYRSAGSDYCSFERLRNFEGTFSSVIGQSGGTGQRIVSIKSTDKGIATWGTCGTWVKLSTVAKAQKTTFKGGATYSVALQIKPGVYKSTNSKNAAACVWSRLRNFEGTGQSIIDLGAGRGPQKVTIKSSDTGFQSTFCGTWKKVG